MPEDAARSRTGCAVGSVSVALAIAFVSHTQELDQGGRLTDFWVRTFAALLLGAQWHPPNTADPDVVPEC
jgi:hypothetical protein